jgi:hypothetical protein
LLAVRVVVHVVVVTPVAVLEKVPVALVVDLRIV